MTLVDSSWLMAKRDVVRVRTGGIFSLGWRLQYALLIARNMSAPTSRSVAISLCSRFGEMPPIR